jgi:hypothetical protein
MVEFGFEHHSLGMRRLDNIACINAAVSLVCQAGINAASPSAWLIKGDRINALVRIATVKRRRQLE